MTSPSLSRRDILKTSGLTFGSATITGCLWGSSSTDEDTAATIEVGPGGRFIFDPETIRISAGDTIEWIWRTHNHNIVPDIVPESASWEGTPGDSTITYGPNYTYEKTFTTLGRYSYYCQPHLPAGMVGTVVVE